MIRDYRLTGKITESVKNEIQLQTTEEYSKVLGAEAPRRGDWIAFVMAQTTVDVGEITETVDGSATVQVTIRSISGEARSKMLAIVQPLGPKLNAFNFEDALILLREHGVRTESVQQKKIKVAL